MLVKHVFRILIGANIVGLLYLLYYPLPADDYINGHRHARAGKHFGHRPGQMNWNAWHNVNDFDHFGLMNQSVINARNITRGAGLKVAMSRVRENATNHHEEAKPLPRRPMFDVISPMCVNLSLGTADLGFANLIRDMRRKDYPRDDQLLRLTDNCDEYKNLRGYRTKPLSAEEADFPIAYGIYVYKSAHQVEQLLRTIYMPQNFYCIHVDQKSPAVLHDAMASVARCFDNVFIPYISVSIPYRSVELLKAERVCMDILLKQGDWKYYLNLAGQEFPLRTNLEIVRTLAAFGGKNDIGSIPNVVPFRQDYLHTTENDVLKMTSRERLSEMPPGDIPLFYGEAHVVLTRPFVNFILTDGNAKKLFEWFNGTDTPEEHYYASLNRLPDAPGGFPHTSWSIARAKLWDDGAKNKGSVIQCEGKYVHDICILTTGDLPWLLRQPFLFANKFHVSADPLVLDCLEEIIGHRTIHPLPLNMQIYRDFALTRTIGNCTNMVNSSSVPQLLFKMSRCALDYSYNRFQNIVSTLLSYERLQGSESPRSD
ncbi:N-acetyllactosaminide beta-1,6-N-acetylglucosaminyl-transferase-like [Saccoglossus kowalevskii]